MDKSCIQELVKLSHTITDFTTKNTYTRFLSHIMSSRGDTRIALKYVENEIKKHKSTKNKSGVDFWMKVQEIVLQIEG